ncbi:MAG: T9SS type A sorting domain-containing protein [Bacteroidetes bacterium]|nr:T9SS type A sorting domain-containing protein [Bacteroidota bacterium]
MSTNNGLNWTSIGSPDLNVYTFSLVSDGSSIFAANGKGLSKTTNDGANWVKSNTGISSLTIRYLTSTGNTMYTAIDPAGVFMSTDNGLNWIERNNDFPNAPYTYGIAASGNNVFTSVFNEGIYKSTNDGANWTSVGPLGVTASSFAFIGTDMYAVGSVVYKSTNNGSSWVQNYSAGVGAMQILHAAAGSVLYAGTRTSGVHVTTNNGVNWSNSTSGITSPDIVAFTSIGNTVFAGTDTAGVFRTTNNGANWVRVNNGLGNKVINALEKAGNFIVAATKGGVYYSSNFGDSWLSFNQGISSSIEVVSLYNYNNTTLYAGTKGQSLFRRPISELTGIKEISGTIADNFVLGQNYPNPFNPVTQINFSISKQASVTLRVFDVSGKEVARLLNKELKNAGNYIAQFSGAELSSGIYFYELQADELSETKKMMLIK